MENKKTYLISHIFFMILSILLMNIFIENVYKEILLILVYFYTIITAVVFVRFFNAYMIFLYTFGLFNLSRIFLDIFDSKSFGWATKFANYYLYKSTGDEVLLVMLLTLLFIHLGFYIAINTLKLDFSINLEHNKRVMKISKILFVLSSPMLLIKLFIQFKLILSLGYNAQYLGVVKTIEYPIYTYGSGTILTIAFILFITSKPVKRDFVIYSSIYLIIKLVDSLKGARALFLTQLLFVIWYYFKEYDFKNRISNLLKIFSFTLVFSQIMLNFREKKIFSLKIVEMFDKFLFSQGVSYLVLAYVIEMKEKIASKLYILQGILGFKAQGYEALETTSSIADELTFMLSKEAYLRGEGIGSNFMAESYLLGYFLMILVFIALGYFIIYYEIKSGKNLILSLFMPYVIPTIFYMSRGPLFGFGLIRYLFFVIISYIIIMGSKAIK